jgi:hypothetical protein
MSQAVSPATSRAYGLARVARIWRLSRATLYRHRAAASAEAPPRRGPVGACSDAELVGHMISSSRAEGTVNHLVNARMNKRRQIRWSPRGAHHVLQVRAAVLNGRFGQQAIQLAA